MRPIVLTMGDPSGIGPEITAQAILSRNWPRPLAVIGCAETLAVWGDVRRIKGLDAAEPGRINVLHIDLAEPARPGQAQPANAPATIAMIEQAAALCRSGAASAMVTAPITKKVLVDGADFPHPGHTEFLAALDGRTRSVMMLACPGLRVVPVTIHIPLSEVPKALTPALLSETIHITHDALQRDFGIAAPRLAVAGLNPHAGEGGLMGREDDAMIAPTLATLRADGMDIRGPLPADTMFHTDARERYDAAITMYHDQGLIPVKTLGFDIGVNATLGLSHIRTSPDHGTAYDIAGKGIARATSMIAAIEMADEMATARHG